MKKLSLILIFLVVLLFYTFGQEQEEIDFLLFLPNSSNQFADEARARTQLDNIARYLRTKTLTDAQIYVYGYAADVQNDIDPAFLSRERALHVINELQRRGIARNFFTNPVGYGSVNLWGNNINEANRSPNRRVRILFEDVIITPEIVEEAEEEILAFEAAEIAEAVQTSQPQSQPMEEDSLNWWWLLLLLLPFLLLLWPKKKARKKKPAKPAPVTKPIEAPVKPIPPVEPASAQKPVVASAVVSTDEAIATVSEPVADTALVRPEGGEPKYYRLTEEEIRNKAYELFEERNHQHGYHDQDWLNAISLLFAKYEAQGYIVLWP